MVTIEKMRRGDKERPTREGVSRGRRQQRGVRPGGNECPDVMFFPEIAITQMRCWLEGKRTPVYVHLLSLNPRPHLCKMRFPIF